MQKFSFGFVLSFALVLVLAACGGDKEDASSNKGDKDEDSKAHIVLKAAHSLSEDHPFEKAFQEMAKNIEERTDGFVKIETFPDSEMGSEHELVKSLTSGTVDLAVTSTEPMKDLVPELDVLDLPFLFNDRQSAVKVLEGEVGNDFFEKIKVHDILPLSWGENGFLHLTNSKQQILEPRDLNGLKIWTQENEFHSQAFSELGAEPVSMEWNDAVTALRRGDVDAQENPAFIAEQFNLYDEGQTYMSLSGHVYSAAIFMMSQKTFDKLPTDVRDIIVEEGRKIGSFQREYTIDIEEESMKMLESQGMEIAREVNVKPFQDALQSMFNGYHDQELVNKIKDAQK